MDALLSLRNKVQASKGRFPETFRSLFLLCLKTVSDDEEEPLAMYLLVINEGNIRLTVLLLSIFLDRSFIDNGRGQNGS
jgi:hypothetical protein